jgi:hypothetical protein
MFKETTKTELPDSNKKPPAGESMKPTRSNRLQDQIPLFTWKQAILEISSKQGYTDIAL